MTLRFFTQPDNQAPKKSYQTTNDQKKIGNGYPITLSNIHLTSFNKSKAILTHQIAKNKEPKTATILVSQGTVTDNAIPPSTSPLAVSKKKLANPLDCSEFK